MKLYSTVRAEASAEQIIEKSKFIAYVSPAQTRQEADEFIASIRKKHKDAKHNVPAMAQGITNVVVVVTRYLGGIKLGTVGLVRAYTSSAKLGLEAAGVCDVCERKVMTYALDYTYLAKLQNLAGGSGDASAGEELFTIENLVYTDVATAELSCVPERADEVRALIANLTGGKGVLKSEEVRIVKV